MWIRAIVGVAAGVSSGLAAWRSVRSALLGSGSSARGTDVRFKETDRKCAGTSGRARYDFLNVKDNEQSVPADAPIKGCGACVLVAEVRVTKSAMFARSAPCIICPNCDRGASS